LSVVPDTAVAAPNAVTAFGPGVPDSTWSATAADEGCTGFVATPKQTATARVPMTRATTAGRRRRLLLLLRPRLGGRIDGTVATYWPDRWGRLDCISGARAPCRRVAGGA
jgi:hypothetical protein